MQKGEVMTDRELLELAAKAMGYEPVRYHSRGTGLRDAAWLEVKKPEATLGNCRWSPLEDDSDALRLAVNLRFTVRISDSGVMVGPHLVVFSESRLDPCAATRRAITRAAAEIGKHG